MKTQLWEHREGNAGRQGRVLGHRRLKPARFICKDKQESVKKRNMEVSWGNVQHEQRAKAQRKEKSQAYREWQKVMLKSYRDGEEKKLKEKDMAF